MRSSIGAVKLILRGASMVHSIGVHLRASVPVQDNFTFVNNRRFRIKPGPRQCSFVTADYRVRFTSDDKPKVTHNLYFGPSFGNTSIVYTMDNVGVGVGIERLTCVRKPEQPGFDAMLWRNHEAFCRSRLASLVANDWRIGYLEHSSQAYYEDALREHALDSAHVKYKLRREALIEMYNTEGVHASRGAGFNSAKMKPGEDAKAKKKSRMIADLQTSSSLVAGFILDDLKRSLDRDQRYEVGGLVVVVRFYKSPSYSNLCQAFSRLANGLDFDCDYFFSVFSDDMCMRGPGGFMCNLDISQCDSSHGDDLFNLMRSVVDVGWYDSAISDVFAQCKRPLTLWDTSHTQKVVLTPLYHTLFSGSTLTTSINTLASTLICLAIVANSGGDPTVDSIISGAEHAGYVVTVDLCPTYHHLQFLKYSPCVDDTGSLVPVLNLGVILRSFGRCKGSTLPVGYTYDDFNSSLVRGFIHAGDHDLTMYLRRRYCSDVPAYSDRYFRLDDHGGYINTTELCVRYGLHPSEFDTMLELHAGACTGDVVWSAASDAIFAKDYGYI